MLRLLLSSLAVLLPHSTVRHVCSLPRAVGTAPNEHSTSGGLQGGGAPVRAALRWCKRAPGPMATAELLPEEEEEGWIRQRTAELLPEEEEEDWIRQRREEEDRSFQARRDAQRRVRAAAWDAEVTARRRALWEEEARAAEAEQQQQQQQQPQQARQQQQQ